MEAEFKHDHLSESLDGTDLQLFRFFLIGICGGLACLVGVICNSLTGVVLFSCRKKKPLYILLLFLTFWDILLLVTSFELNSIDYLLRYFGIGQWYLDFIHSAVKPTVYALRSLARFTGSWLTIAITLERFIAIKFPFKAYRYCSKKYTIYGSICIMLGSIIFTLPRWLEYEIHPIYKSNFEQNVTEVIGYEAIATCLSMDPIYKTYYLRWGHFVLTCLIPFCIMAVLNFIIFQQIRKMHKKAKLMTDTETNEEHSLTRMIFTIVLVSLTKTLLCLILTSWDTVFLTRGQITSISDPDIHLEVSQYGWTVENLVVVINSCINPLFYCAFGKQFQTEFVHFWWRKKPNTPGINFNVNLSVDSDSKASNDNIETTCKRRVSISEIPAAVNL